MKTLLNIDKAVTRVLKAKENKENIAIWGDYDGDGISAATLLYEALIQGGFEIKKLLLPNRYKIGIGLKNDLIKKLAKDKIDLLITVDFGIANIKESKLVKKLGMDLIILDHHLPKKNLPAGIVVDPKQKGEKYPYKDFTAAGVAYKFIEFLFYKLGRPRAELEQFSDLVAISIITDKVAQTGENKKLLKAGIKRMNQALRLGSGNNLRPGIKIYLDHLKIKKINTKNINKLTNLIENPEKENENNTMFKLYQAKTGLEAKKASQPIIKRFNKIKKALEKSWQKADKFFSQHPPQNVIIWKEEKNIPGIKGDTATKLYGKYGVPAFVYGRQNKKTFKVSVRAPKGYNVVKAFDSIKDVLTGGYGGHLRAAGAEFPNKNEKKFIRGLEKFYKK